MRVLLHETKTGRWLVDQLWKKMESDLLDQVGINKHEELKKLKPDAESFWYATNIGIMNYPTSFHELVTEGKVQILRKDVETLEGGNKIRFTDGGLVEADALLCRAGWQFAPRIEFLSKSIHDSLGIPSTELSQTQKEERDKLCARADVEILRRFPKLAEGS